MFKKMALITLFVLFAGILIYGAVNRTTARAELTKHTQTENLAANGHQSLGEEVSTARGHGQGNQGQGSQGQGQGNQGQGQGAGGQGQSQGRQGQGQGGGQGQGQGRQGQDAAGQGRVWQQIPERVTISGTVIQAPELGVDMIVETDDGEVLVGTGPSYLAEQGFMIATSDQVDVEGFWEKEEFKAVTITLVAEEKSIVLRDEWGRPMWSAGRNAQNRQNNQDGL